nr:hypothetical protein [Agrobacterium fabrum]
MLQSSGQNVAFGLLTPNIDIVTEAGGGEFKKLNFALARSRAIALVTQ